VTSIWSIVNGCTVGVPNSGSDFKSNNSHCVTPYREATAYCTSNRNVRCGSDSESNGLTSGSTIYDTCTNVGFGSGVSWQGDCRREVEQCTVVGIEGSWRVPRCSVHTYELDVLYVRVEGKSITSDVKLVQGCWSRTGGESNLCEVCVCTVGNTSGWWGTRCQGNVYVTRSYWVGAATYLDIPEDGTTCTTTKVVVRATSAWSRSIS